MAALWQNLPQFALVAALMVVCYYFMRQAGRRSVRRSDSHSSPTVRELSRDVARDRALSDAPPEVVRWQVEMHETARDLKAELDSKMLALQALIRLANEERAKLQAAIDQAQSGAAGSEPLPRSPLDTPQGQA